MEQRRRSFEAWKRRKNFSCKNNLPLENDLRKLHTGPRDWITNKETTRDECNGKNVRIGLEKANLAARRNRLVSSFHYHPLITHNNRPPPTQQSWTQRKKQTATNHKMTHLSTSTVPQRLWPTNNKPSRKTTHGHQKWVTTQCYLQPHCLENMMPLGCCSMKRASGNVKPERNSRRIRWDDKEWPGINTGSWRENP